MKNIIITGASKGIGRAIALRFAAEGYAIAACARGIDGLRALEAEVLAACPQPEQPHIFMTCDMADASGVRLFAERITAQWLGAEILVNNAGVFLPGAVLTEADGTLEQLIETNLYSAYHITRLLAPAMKTNMRGHIFNVCSVASLHAYPNGGSYSISKFAMLGLSRALREELKPYRVRVTSLLPGATLTDSWAGVDLPESRFMKAEDIAHIVYDIYQLSEHTVIEDIVLRPMEGDI